MKLHLRWPVSLVTAALVLAGCSSSDSGSTEESSASSSAETTSAAAASPELQKAADDYKGYAVGQANELVRVVKVLTDAVRAGDLKAAQDAYAPSRMPWERIEPIAGLVEDTDAKTDSRVDDFANVDDPKFTGWHRLEYLLFEKNTTEGGAPFADQLDKDIANLQGSAADRRGETDRRRQWRSRTHRRGVGGQAHRRGGSVRQDRLVGLRREPAGLAGRHRQAERAAGEAPMPRCWARSPAGSPRSSTPCGRCARAMDGCMFCPENSEFPSPRCPSVTVQPPVVDALKAQLAGLSENLSQVAGALKLK